MDAARPCRHAVGARWYVDETYVKVAGIWRYVYQAIDKHGQVIDVPLSKRRDTTAARAFFANAVVSHSQPDEVITDRAAALAHVIAETLPDARHNTAQYANNRIRYVRGHAFTQNVRPGHYELGTKAPQFRLQVTATFDELTSTI